MGAEIDQSASYGRADPSNSSSAAAEIARTVVNFRSLLANVAPHRG
jgi:hypothetical protein